MIFSVLSIIKFFNKNFAISGKNYYYYYFIQIQFDFNKSDRTILTNKLKFLIDLGKLNKKVL